MRSLILVVPLAYPCITVSLSARMAHMHSAIWMIGSFSRRFIYSHERADKDPLDLQKSGVPAASIRPQCLKTKRFGVRIAGRNNKAITETSRCHSSFMKSTNRAAEPRGHCMPMLTGQRWTHRTHAKTDNTIAKAFVR